MWARIFLIRQPTGFFTNDGAVAESVRGTEARWPMRPLAGAQPPGAANARRNALGFAARQTASHEFGESAFGAKGVRVVAKIPDDLEQTLLKGGRAKLDRMTSAEQSVPGQSKDRVILGRRPFKIGSLGLSQNIGTMSFSGARPEPGNNDIDGEVG